MYKIHIKKLELMILEELYLFMQETSILIFPRDLTDDFVSMYIAYIIMLMELPSEICIQWLGLSKL